MHARIDEGCDGRIYFSATLNDGNRASRPACKWSEAIPGGQLYRYDPRTGEASLVVNLPSARATATSLLDRDRNRWWCNLEGGSNALWAVDLSTMQTLYEAPAGSMAFNRNFALARDGSVYFNGQGGIWKCDAAKQEIVPTRSVLPGAGMRATTRESHDGWIYGVTMRPGRLFRYSPEQDKLEMLGPDFLVGDYTAVCVLSPDERFLYYLPGAHGSAFRIGTPVVQYDIAQGRRKVLAFLQPALEAAFGYVPAGTYGVKLSADGGTLYVNFNGHAADAVRPEEMRPIGFGLTAFAAIHIPEGER
jgi:sugar lactone lactonase YvrE